MKEVLAIIRPEKMNATKIALASAGISSLTGRKVMGRGKGLVDSTILAGAQQGIEEAIAQLSPEGKFFPKRMLTIVVNDHNLEKTVKTIIAANKTGKPGDGRIFVQTVTSAARVRTGEVNEEAILEEGETITAGKEA